MQDNTNATTTRIVNVSGRDGKREIAGPVEVAKVLGAMNEELAAQFIECAARTLIHRTADAGGLPDKVTTNSFIEAVLSYGSGGAGRYKVSKADQTSGQDLYNKHMMLGDGEKWAEAFGLPFNLATCIQLKFQQRVKAEEAKKAALADDALLS